MLACFATLVMVIPGEGAHVSGEDAVCGAGAASLMQRRAKEAQKFIHHPLPMSKREMAEVNTTGMEKKMGAELAFFTYPGTQDTLVSNSISPTGYWEKDVSDDFCKEYGKLAGKADFLDVGANIGTWSIPMALCLQSLNRGGSVIAVEALKLNADHMAASVHANHLDNINLFNYAVGEGGPQDQAFEKVEDKNKGHSNIVSSSGDADAESVSMTTLDTILEDRLASNDSRIFGMKMDIENYELYALRGAPKLLSAEHRPCVIYIELRVDTHEPSARAMELLENAGYVKDPTGFGYVERSDDHLLRQKDFAACMQRFAA